MEILGRRLSHGSSDSRVSPDFLPDGYFIGGPQKERRPKESFKPRILSRVRHDHKSARR